MEEKIEQLKELVEKSQKIVFFGGAGVSTESGIPDFRSVDGLYNQKWAYPPEIILSATFFHSNPKEFYRFYREKLLVSGIKPNITHFKLAELEKQGKLLAVVTQNIDGLHQKAGSIKVYELHGSIHRNYCMECGKFFDADYIKKSSGVPKCTCGGIIKPDVVLYEEGLDNEILNNSINSIAHCDTLIIGGTSLNVYPAASLIQYFRGDNLVLINKSPTSADRIANLRLNGNIGEIFSQIKV